MFLGSVSTFAAFRFFLLCLAVNTFSFLITYRLGGIIAIGRTALERANGIHSSGHHHGMELCVDIIVMNG